MIASGDRDGIQAKRPELPLRFGNPFLGEVPGIGVDRAIAHSAGWPENQPSFR